MTDKIDAAMSTDSECPGADGNLVDQALSFYQAGDLIEAEKLCARVSQAATNYPVALHLLSAISLSRGQIDEAVKQCERAAQLDPGNANILNGLAIALHAAKQFQAALSAIDQAILLVDDDAELYASRSLILSDLGNLRAALTAAEKAIAINAICLAAINNKGRIYQKIGRADLAIESFDRALQIQPGSSDLIFNKLTTINYSPKHTTKDVLEVTKKYWTAIGVAKDRTGVSKKSSQEKPFVIGFISADFRRHAVGFLLRPYLNNRDRGRYKVHLYYNHSDEDDLTFEFKNGCDGWEDICGVSDKKVAEKIMADKVDILIDLSGHTDGHRLGVMALKPARVQATWLGYVATTGVPEIDFIICDKFVLPENNEKYFLEKPFRLANCYLSFAPPDMFGQPSPLPFASNGHIVFGSFNNLIKVNPTVLGVWATILQKVAGSRLLLKCPQLSDTYVRSCLMDVCSECGIEMDRLILLGNTSREEHLLAYSQVDVALDTFPYGGGITTAEALWMGVPVVTLSGDSWQSRAGHSILEAVGVPQFVSHSAEEYIDTAIELACNTDELAMTRRNLRAIMQSSSFCDEKRIAREIDDAFMKMWNTAQV